MHHRLSFWVALVAFFSVAIVRAQTPAPAGGGAPAPDMIQAQIIAAKITGVVTLKLDAAETPLKNGDVIPVKGTVITGNDSSVVLVFSNGATTQLGADTQLNIEEFNQDPFPATTNVSSLAAEPTTSKTKLHLKKGELVGAVKHLNRDKGSTFTVQTPVGAAGIRGTTFRIVFRPDGSGQAFLFSLSTVEGNVNFQGQGGTTAATPTGVDITGQQEVVVTVQAEIAPDGTIKITAPPEITSTTTLDPAKSKQIADVAIEAVKTADSTNFSTSASSNSGSGNSGSSDTKSEEKKTEETKTEEKKSGETSGGESAGSNSTNSGSGTSSTSTSTPSTAPINPSPSPTTTPSSLTPGAGQSTGTGSGTP